MLPLAILALALGPMVLDSPDLRQLAAGPVVYGGWDDLTCVPLPGVGRRCTDALFVEMLADFNSGGFELPAGHAAHPIPGAAGYELKLTATGAAGATSITATGSIGSAGVTSAGWAAVIQHNDGTWGVYTVTAANTSTGVLTIRPPLRAAVTAKTLANLHNATNGQHYTPTGYVAMGEHTWAYSPLRAMRSRYIAQTKESEAAPGKWSMLGGLNPVRMGCNYIDNYFTSTNPLSTVAWARSKTMCRLQPANTTGQGVSWTVALGGRTGYLDSYASTRTPSDPMRVEVIVDGVTKLDKQLNGIERIVVPFSNATTGTIRYTATSGDGAGTHQYGIGTTTWWATEVSVPSQLIPPGSKVVYLGDSWGEYYSGIGPSTIASKLAASGGTLINSSSGGKTAQWALDNWDSLVGQHAPTVVIYEFFTNDRNAATNSDPTAWLGSMRALIVRARRAGILPVVIMPAPTSSQNQGQWHAFWASQMAEGTPL